MSSEPSKILVISGPAGVGKSTLGWEIARHLKASGISHAVLDSDELDRVWPISHAAQETLCRDNLAAFWTNAHARGVRHLVLVGVFLDPDLDRPWIDAAVPGAEIARVVLDASDRELERRVRQREVGSGADYQLRRTLAAAQLFRVRHPAEPHVLHTDSRSVADLAVEAIRLSGWSATPTPAEAATGPAPGRLVVREYEPGDHGACRALWAELTEHHRRIYADRSIGGDDPGAYFDLYLATYERMASWVADVEGRVVGLTGLFDRGDGGEVEPMVVREELRGSGVGRALLERVVAEARERNYAYLTIRPVARNTAAIRRFHSWGFRTLGGHIDLSMDLAPRRHVWLSYAHLHGLDFKY